jgi:regulator of sigma E protease
VAGLQAGDKIVEINGAKTSSWQEVSEGIRDYDGKGSLEMTVTRNGEKVTTEVTPQYNEEAQSYMIGITAGVSKDLWECIKQGPRTTWELNKAMLQSFAMLFSGKLTADDVAGPVGLVKVVDQAASYGIAPYLTLLALVSLNLAIFNIIPIPGLDGGKIFFIILKVISRGKIDDEMEYKATLVGMALILMLFILITFNDVKNLFG